MMFSIDQKKKIAAAVEEVLLSFNHPEMPKEKPDFVLKVSGKEAWSWAEIVPNWIFEDGHKEMNVNPFNELQAKRMEQGG